MPKVYRYSGWQNSTPQNLRFRDTVYMNNFPFWLAHSLSSLSAIFKIWIAIRVPMKTPLTGQLQLLLRIKEREGWNERKSESNRWQNGACCNWMKHFWKWHKNMLILRIILQHCGRNAVIHLAFVLSWWQNTLFRATRACLVLVINKNIFIYIFM